MLDRIDQVVKIQFTASECKRQLSPEGHGGSGRGAGSMRGKEKGSASIMDITVSRLNERMALRVPSELPLGLVFIVGRIEGMQTYPSRPDEVALQLTEGEHSLPCRLPSQVVDEMQLVGHERVRAGGHLVFDPRQARYFLLARDIEVLPSDPDAVPLPAAVEPTEAAVPETIVEVQEEPSPLVPGELPPWVRQLAPPEIQAELGLLGSDLEPDAYAERLGDDFQLPPLPPEIVDYLSAAIDSEQDVELTSDVFNELMAEESGGEPEASIPELTVSELDLQPQEAEEPEPIVRKVSAPGRIMQDEVQTSSLLPLSSQQLTLVLLASIFGFLFLVLLVLLIIALAGGFTLPLPA